MSGEITVELKHPEVIVLLLLLSIFLFLELQTTLNTPISFGDEGFHTRMAQYIAEEREYSVNYRFYETSVWKEGYSRPPLWNMVEAGFLFVLGFREGIVKFLTPFISILTGLSVFLIAKKLYSKEIAFIASVIAVTIPSFVTYSVFFYVDILFSFYLTLFFMMFILFLKSGSRKYMILSGVFGAFAFLTKTPGVVVYFFAMIMFLYELMKEKKFYDLFGKYFAFVLILVLIPSMFFLRNFYYYGTPSCDLPVPFFNNDGCTSGSFKGNYEFSGRTEQTGTEQSILRMGIVSYLDFAYGNVWFVVFGFVGGLFILFLRRDATDVLILLTLLTLIPVIYKATYPSGGRAEDVARYLVGWVPIIAIVAAKYFSEVYSFVKGYHKYVALFVLILIVVYSLFGLRVFGVRGYGIIDKLFGYDAGSSHVTGLKDVKQFSPMFFESCDWIEANTPEDSLLFTIWVHRAVYNCQRNVVGNFPDMSQSNNLDYTLEIAKKHGITHVFVQKFSIDPANQHLGERFDLDFVKLLENNPDSFKKIHENGPPLEQCLQQGGCDGNILYEIEY